MRVFIFFVLMIFYQVGNLYAQTGGWLMYWGIHPIGNKWELYSEAQVRQKRLPLYHDQVLVRGGLGYKLRSNWSVGAGYGGITFHTDEEIEWYSPDYFEHRYWVQSVYKSTYKRLIIEHRLRGEYRDVAFAQPWRLRYRLHFDWKIHRSMPFNIHISNEIFLHNSPTVYDRNRFYGAMGYHCSQHCEVQLGGLQQNVGNTNYRYVQLGFLLH